MKKLDEAIERFSHNAEYERTHGSLQGCLEFRQLVKWLKELKAYREMYRKEHMDDCLRSESDHKYQKAIQMLAEEYRKSQAMAFVHKPMAYALYQVWKYFDEHEKPRIAEGSDKE